MFHLSLQERYFQAVLAGAKRVEGRLAKHKYFTLNPGDKISFSSEGSCSLCIVCKVIGVNYFRTFKEMLEKKGIEAMLPGETSIEDGVAIYRQFYSQRDEQRYGVAAIEIEVEKSV